MIAVETLTEPGAIKSHGPALADIHAAAFAASESQAWTIDDLAALAERPGAVWFIAEGGFLLAQLVLDEAEILTLAVSPKDQGQRVGHALIHSLLTYITLRHVMVCHLEVATDNIPAIALYRSAGFRTIATRPAYFKRQNGHQDAFIMERRLSGK